MLKTKEKDVKIMNIKWLKGNEDTKNCFKVRQEVFVDEQGFTNEFDETDDIAYHLSIEDGEKNIATARIYKDDEGIFHAGRICVLKEYRKNHLGALIMSEISKKVSLLDGKKIVLSAQVRAKPFYEKQGYIAFGEEYLDEYCPHIDMYKNIK